MKPGRHILAVLVVAASLLAQAAKTYPVVRLKPSVFPELPRHLAAELDRRSCRIPQPYTDRKANVIRGSFAKAGQTDWAAVCSVGGFSSILVFWNASPSNPAEIAKWQEEPTVIYDHFIRPVGRKLILDHYRAYGGPKPPPIDHQGIESGGERASVVLYYHRGEWLKLQGAD